MKSHLQGYFLPYHLFTPAKNEQKKTKQNTAPKENTFFRLLYLLSYGNHAKKPYLMTLSNLQDLLGNTTCH